MVRVYDNGEQIYLIYFGYNKEKKMFKLIKNVLDKV